MAWTGLGGLGRPETFRPPGPARADLTAGLDFYGPGRPVGNTAASAPDPVAQWVETQKKETAAPQKKEETAAPRAPPPAAEEKEEDSPPPPIPDWESIREMLHSVGITWGTVLAARWKRSWKRTGSDSDPTEGAFLMIEFCDDSYEEFDILVGGPDDPLPETPPPPQPLGLSPIHTILSEWTPPPEALGFSPIVTALSEEPSPESTTPPQTIEISSET
ncbi:hypothetical protein BDZ91DRAFT_509354 [Kalaharituber pfeilii]|nr:hypothetical protein BDZ91DRAFT_509354 [Kalaharituber pfeilii]